MFTGEYQHTLDSKGRLIVPSRMREELGERFMITRGLDQCLFIYPLEEWARIEQKLWGSESWEEEREAKWEIEKGGMPGVEGAEDMVQIIDR